MPSLKPFKALRPSPEIAQQVILDKNSWFEAEVQEFLLRKNPFSFLHILSPAQPNMEPVEKLKGLELSKKRMEQLIEQSQYFKEEIPALYVYQTNFKENVQTGIIGCVNAQEYNNNLIKKHENTRVDREKELGSVLASLRLNTTPVQLTYKQNPVIEQLVFNTTKTEPLYELNHETGLGISIWSIVETYDLKLLQDEFAKTNAFYIADGHHRAKIAANFAAENAHNAESQWFTAILIPFNQLFIYPFYRRIKKEKNIHLPSVLKMMKSHFTIKPTNLDYAFYQYQQEQSFLLCTKDETWEITPKEKFQYNSVLDNLDVSILQNQILEPYFNVEKPTSDPNISFGSRNISISEFKELLNNAQTECIFLVRAPSVDQVIEIADRGEIMPPKSTSFEPKIISGLVLHEI